MAGSLLDQLTAEFTTAFESLGAPAQFGSVGLSKKPEFAQFQCNGSMGAAKALGKNPREVAELVINAIPQPERFRDLSIAGPGFINISLTDEALAHMAAQRCADATFGFRAESPKKRVVVDYGGPNVAKPMHVGHLRSSIIGDSIVRLMRFAGHEVLGDIHLGDWGTQMGMLIVALSEEFPELPYFDPAISGEYPTESPVTIQDLQVIYPKISARCKEDSALHQKAQAATVELQQGNKGYKALWQHFVDVSIQELKDDFQRLGVQFDLWYGESFYHDRIPPMVNAMKQAGHAIEDQGAVIIPVAKESDTKEFPPVMLLKSDGGTNYHTTDLATIAQRTQELQADLILYVVDKRQSLHFEQCFRAAEITGIAKNASLEHLGFGTMNGPDGKPFKTRAGGVMRLKDLMEMMTHEARTRMLEEGVGQQYDKEEQDEIAEKVGMSSLRYADLMNVRSADYVFDIERFTQFKGRTGAYLCYTAVRIKSILRKSAENGFAVGTFQPPATAVERDLMIHLGSVADYLHLAVNDRMPHHLCSFLFELAQAFSRFYTECHILTEENETTRGGWLALCTATLNQVELLFSLLGMEAPERM
ncbi:MAG: arginine--tRNA ligase [Sumerlaeia bacterium]